MPSDVTGDDIGAPPLCAHHQAVIENLADQEEPMTTPTPRWHDLDDAPPEAHYQRAGRVTWSVWVTAGISQWGPDGGVWLVHGLTPAHAERRAARKAGKVLAKYLSEQERRTEHHTIATHWPETSPPVSLEHPPAHVED